MKTKGKGENRKRRRIMPEDVMKKMKRKGDGEIETVSERLTTPPLFVIPFRSTAQSQL